MANYPEFVDYQALYRKYRPQRFSEVVGQDHVTTTLAREVNDKKIAHAYLFAGPRGTGKTTSARLLAKALNCTDLGEDAEPCNGCASCAAITTGSSLDVIELDAASHNKVEDIREMRVNVGTVAIGQGARRVYILDEAHMLSRAAGNALLKTLEEPPGHVVFVLATTEPYKLLDTIRSRTQRFDFHPVPDEVLTQHLTEIASREGFTCDQAGLAAIADHSGGLVRDALSFLEQVAALGRGHITVELAGRALGIAQSRIYSTLAKSVKEADAVTALGLVTTLAAQGSDLRRFVSDAIGFFRGVFLAQYTPNLEEAADESMATLAHWRQHADLLSPGEVLRAVDILGETLHEIRQGREERLVVELALIRLTRPETSPDIDSLLARVGRLESQLRMLQMTDKSPTPAAETASPPDSTVHGSHTEATPTVATTDHTPKPSAPLTAVEDPQQPPPVRTAAPDCDVSLSSFEAVWPSVVARVREDLGPRLHALLKEAIPVRAESGVVTLELPAHLPFHFEQLRADGQLQAAMAAIAGGSLGTAITFAFQMADVTPLGSEPPVRAPDKDTMAPAESQSDAAAMVVDIFGGELISE